jgi:hypothetical protein
MALMAPSERSSRRRSWGTGTLAADLTPSHTIQFDSQDVIDRLAVAAHQLQPPANSNFRAALAPKQHLMSDLGEASLFLSAAIWSAAAEALRLLEGQLVRPVTPPRRGQAPM